MGELNSVSERSSPWDTLTVIFAWMRSFDFKNTHSSENDRQVSHGLWRSKTVCSSPMRSFWYLFDVQGSKWPEVTACWIFDHFADSKSPKFSVWSYGSVCVVRIGMKTLQSVELYMRIKKMYTCWGRTRHHDELARFGHRWVFSPRKSTIAGFFFPYSSYMLT